MSSLQFYSKKKPLQGYHNRHRTKFKESLRLAVAAPASAASKVYFGFGEQLTKHSPLFFLFRITNIYLLYPYCNILKMLALLITHGATIALCSLVT